MPSNRRFGYWFAAIFTVLTLWSLYRGGSVGAVVLAVLAIAFAVAASVVPDRLAPLNRTWFRFGELLGRVVSPVVLGVLFFVVLTPVALVGRFLGRDALRLKRRPADSYWVGRETPNPDSQSFRRQY